MPATIESAAHKALERTPLTEEEVNVLSPASTVEILDLGFDETDVVLIQNFLDLERQRLNASELPVNEAKRIKKFIRGILEEKLM